MTKTTVKLSIPARSIQESISKYKTNFTTNPAIAIISLLEWFAIISIFLNLVFYTNASSANWISAVVFLVSFRLVRILFEGFRALPQVSFDLMFLSLVTTFLVANIVQGQINGALALETRQIWDIGTLLLSLITSYAVAVKIKSLGIFKTVYRLFFALISLSSYVYILDSLLTINKINLPGSNLIYFFTTIWAIILFRKSSGFARVMLLFALPGLVLATLIPFSINFVVIFASAVILLFVLAQRIEVVKVLFLSNISRRNKIITLAVMLGLIIFATVAINTGLVAASTTTGNFVVPTDLQQIFFGRGITGSTVTALQLFNRFGLLGVIATLIFTVLWLVIILKRMAEAAHKSQLQSLFFLVILYIVSLFFFSVNIPVVIFGIFLLIFSTAKLADKNDKKVNAAGDFLKTLFAGKPFSRIMPKDAWIDLLDTLRILIAVSIVVYSFVVIDFLRTIFYS